MQAISKAITIDDTKGWSVIVSEITVGQMRGIITGVVDDFGDQDFMKILTEDLNIILSRITPYCQLVGDGVSFEDMTFSQLELIWNAFKEVNKALFLLIPIDQILNNIRLNLGLMIGASESSIPNSTVTSAS